MWTSSLHRSIFMHTFSWLVAIFIAFSFFFLFLFEQERIWFLVSGIWYLVSGHKQDKMKIITLSIQSSLSGRTYELIKNQEAGILTCRVIITN